VCGVSNTGAPPAPRGRPFRLYFANHAFQK
jgi:hypothetical protein